LKKNNKGFTLAELLIVVAIIAVLVAIAIPVFTVQLERSRDATSIANIRSAYAEAMSEYLAGDDIGADEVTIDRPVNIQTAQANDWSDQAANLSFTAPADPGSVNAMTEMTATFTFTTDEEAETTVTCELN